jgi:hypothetical protein
MVLVGPYYRRVWVSHQNSHPRADAGSAYPNIQSGSSSMVSSCSARPL